MKITRKALAYNLREDAKEAVGGFQQMRAAFAKVATALLGFGRAAENARACLQPLEPRGDHGTDPFAEQDGE